MESIENKWRLCINQMSCYYNKQETYNETCVSFTYIQLYLATQKLEDNVYLFYVEGTEMVKCKQGLTGLFLFWENGI